MRSWTSASTPPRPVYEQQMRESGDPHFHPPVMEELKAEARQRGLWNLFHPDPEVRPRADEPRVRAAGRDHGPQPTSRPRRCNCAAPDTGNMEVLTQFGTAEQQGAVAAAAARRRDPLGVRDDRAATSRAPTPPTSRLRIERDGDDYVLNGRKWWTSGALHQHCQILIVMGKTDPDGRAAPPAVDDARAARHARRDGRAQPAGVRLPATSEGHGEVALRGRARAGHEPARRRGRRLRDRPGAPRPGPHPPLHARDRHGRAGARADVQARRRARDVRQAARRAGRTSRTGSPSRASRSRWRAC